MIGTKYTPELLAALAKTPHLRSMEIPASPDGQRIASYTTRSLDEGVCKTMFFDVTDEELASITVDYDAGGIRFGSILGRDVEKVTVSVIEETHTDVDKITSFFEDATSDEPWLVIVEPVEHE